MHPDRLALPILSAIVVCTLPHFLAISLWAIAACLLLWGYAVLAIVHSWRLPGRPLLRILAGILLVAAMTTHEGLTIEAFVALLSLMAALKIFEIRDHRDRMITVILCYFLIAGRIFFGDSMGDTLYIFLSILFTTAVLLHINQPRTDPVHLIRPAGILLMQALPFMLVFFLFFPRFQGGLWGLSRLNTARTGFSEEMNFGNIANLARNTDVAFRVDFDGPLPARDLLYWRGIVLDDFDGQTWRRGKRTREQMRFQKKSSSDIGYTVTLEPHNMNWLFTLELPSRISFRGAYLLSDHSIYRWRPITSRITYSAVSNAGSAPQSNLRPAETARQLPQTGNSRSRALAADLRQQSNSEEEYIEKVLSYFREQPFVYSMQPPTLEAGDPSGPDYQGASRIDRFLFESRKGFCEHYAGSFAFLMRAAGIPTRVVAGYLGGRLNPYGDYLVVRQSDAHAWCEVWLPEKGWVRVDPTSAVAPARVTEDATSALPAEETAGILALVRTGAWGQGLQSIINVLDYWNNRWNHWVMGYSINEQGGLLTRLGLELKNEGNLPAILAYVLGGTTMVIILIFTLLFRPKKPYQDPTGEAWLDFCRKMERIGLPRRPDQGPLAYLDHITRHRPDLAAMSKELITTYVRLRYSASGGPSDVMRLRALLKRFQPGKAQRG
ncbi:MAG: transglutaminase TgpA family protein [Thermodesulfobacteriota bacterium]